MRNEFLRVLLLSLISFFSLNIEISSQDYLRKGWEAFNNNNRSEAIQFFSLASNNDTTIEDGYLGLCFVYMSEGKHDEAFNSFVKFFNHSSNPYPYVYALWYSDAINYNFTDKKDDKLINFFNQILNDPRANGTIRALVYSMLGYQYEKTWQFSESEKSFNYLGMTLNWEITGAFDNVSGSGFDKNYGPIFHPEENADFSDRNGAQVKWFNASVNRRDLWLDFVYHFITTNSILYAQSFVLCPEKREVIIRTGVSGSVKLWINDKLIVNEEEERNTDLDVYNYSAILNKGYNRILVQIGSSEIDRSNFMVRITDENGSPYHDLIYTADYKSYDKNSEYDSKKIPVFAENFFEEKVKKSPDNLLNYLLLAETYLRCEKKFQCRQTLTLAKNLAPKNSYIVEKLLDVYLRSDNRTEYTKEVEWLKDNDPDNKLAIRYLINEAAGNEDKRKLTDLVEKLEKIEGQSEEVMEIKIQYQNLLDLKNEVINIIDNAYSKCPDNYSFVSAKYYLEKNRKKTKEAIKVLEKYLKKNFDKDAMGSLADAYFSTGNAKKGFEVYQKLINSIPYACGYYNNMANLYASVRNYDKALEFQLKAISLAPYIGSYYSNLAGYYELINRNDLALESYKKSITLYPNNYTVRSRIRKLEEKKDAYEYFDQPDVYQIYKESPTGNLYPESNSIILINEKQRIVYERGASEEKNILLAKVFNTKGIENWKEYSIPYNSNNQRLIIEKAEVLKANGSKITAEVNDNYVVFTSLEPNDAIHLTYRIQNYLTGKLANHFWDKFNFDFFIPCLNSKYVLLIHKDHKLKYQLVNAIKNPIISNEDEFIKYVWELDSLNEIKNEIYMPPLSDVGIILHLTTIQDWDFISKWYSDISSTKSKTDFEVNEAINQIFSPDTIYSDYQKAEKIYRYIVKNIQYSSLPFRQSGYVPQEASKTINTKLGDCKDVSTLFVALAKEVGLKANLVLVDTRENGEKDMVLPTLEFDHCIARVFIDNKEYYIELTSELLPFRTIANYERNSLSLNIPINQDTSNSDLFYLPKINAIPNITYRRGEASFIKNNLVISRYNERSGISGAMMRYYYGSSGPDQRKELMTQSISADFTNPIKLYDLNFENINSLDDTIKYYFSLEVSNFLNDVGGMKIFKLPWSDINYLSEILSIEKRKYPINLWNVTYDDEVKEDLVITLPQGMKMVEMPKNVKISLPAMEYEITFEIKDNIINACRKLKMTKDIIQAEGLNELKSFIEEMNKIDNQQYAIK